MGMNQIRLGQIKEERDRFPEKFKKYADQYFDEIYPHINLEPLPTEKKVEVLDDYEADISYKEVEEIKPKKRMFSKKKK